MAITVDYTLTPFRITIPKSDLTLISGTKYSLDVDVYWNLLSDYSDSDESIPHPLMYGRIPATSSTPSITEINLTNYDLVFEDGLYSVNIINGNTNIREAEVKNQVSVSTNNTTGFIDPVFLEYGTFDGSVWINTVTGGTGTKYPMGSPSSPVNNLTDAKVIAAANGFVQFQVTGTFVFDAADVVDGFIFQGLSSSKTTLILTEAATITNCIFRECTITGQLDGGNDASFCVIGSLNYLDGSLLDCFLTGGTITLNGAQANLLRCASAVAGGGVDDTPIIDMGETGTALVIRDYQGGIKLTNYTSGSDPVSIDMSSGRIILDSTISSGTFNIRGVGSVVDQTTGAAIVHVDVLDSHNLNRATFTNGGVYVEAGSAYSGETYPRGTPVNPVNNFPDAIAIANREGLTHIFMVGFFALAGTEVLDGITVVGGSGSNNVLGLTSGVSTDAAGFEQLIVYGELGGLSRIKDCILGIDGLGGFTNCEGRVIDSIINSTSGVVQKTLGAGTLFDNCSFITPDDVQIPLDANGKGFSLRKCTGNILIENGTIDENQQIHLLGGKLEFAASCTGGTFSASGMGEITDNSVGAIVDRTNILETSKIADEIWDVAL